jgi:hypothetical protein
MKTSATKAPSPPVRTVVTTLALPIDTWRALKIRAAHERASLKTICMRAMLAYLETPLPKETA